MPIMSPAPLRVKDIYKKMKKFVYLIAASLLLCGFCGCSSDDEPQKPQQETPDPDPIPDPVPDPVKTYNLGDYYESGAVKGVVYYVNSTGEHGRIVSLEEWEAQWQIDHGFAVEAQTIFQMDAGTGYYNWQFITGVPDWKSRFPAFACCNRLNSASVIGWYLPTLRDLEQLYAAFNGDASESVNQGNRDLFNQVLTGHGGTALSGSIYWSSTEMGPQHTYVCNFGSLHTGEMSDALDKTETHKVRAVKNF